MKKLRNILAMLMVFVMLVAVMPMNVFAGDGDGTNPPVEGTEQPGDQEEDPLKGEKDAAIATVNGLENILDADREAAIEAINAATTEDAINKAVNDAKAKDDEAKKAKEEELKKAKEEAVAKVDELTHLTDDEKKAAKDKINAASTPDAVQEALDAAQKQDKEKAEEAANTEYDITIVPSENGKVEADVKKAKEGVDITLTITPKTGYKLKELKVMAGDKEVEVKDNKFKMPASVVKVTSEFEKKTEEKPTPAKTVKVVTKGKGTASVDKPYATYLDTVTVTATPSAGYVVSRIYYRNNKTGVESTIKNYGNGYYYDGYYYGYKGKYYDEYYGYYGDYYRYYSDYEKNYYTAYSSYDAYLKDRHYSFWNNGYRYWDDYDYKYYNRYYDRYYDGYYSDYYRYYDDYVDNYYRKYSSYEDYLYDKHYSHYRDYRYYDGRYYNRYYYDGVNYTVNNTFTMPASDDVTVYVEFTDWAYYGYYYDDYYYYRYHRNKKDNYYERQKKAEEKAEEEIVVEKTPQVFEASATINVGSNVFTKVNKNVTTKHQMDVAAYVKNGRVMLPLRYVAEALGLQVSWVPETKTVIIWDLTQRVEIPIKSNKMIVNGVAYTSDVKPEINSSRTMLPIANVARALGLIDGTDIIWDPVMKQVKLTRRVLSK